MTETQWLLERWDLRGQGGDRLTRHILEMSQAQGLTTNHYTLQPLAMDTNSRRARTQEKICRDWLKIINNIWRTEPRASFKIKLRVNKAQIVPTVCPSS